MVDLLLNLDFRTFTDLGCPYFSQGVVAYLLTQYFNDHIIRLILSLDLSISVQVSGLVLREKV